MGENSAPVTCEKIRKVDRCIFSQRLFLHLLGGGVESCTGSDVKKSRTGTIFPPVTKNFFHIQTNHFFFIFSNEGGGFKQLFLKAKHRIFFLIRKCEFFAGGRGFWSVPRSRKFEKILIYLRSLFFEPLKHTLSQSCAAMEKQRQVCENNQKLYFFHQKCIHIHYEIFCEKISNIFFKNFRTHSSECIHIFFTFVFFSQPAGQSDGGRNRNNGSYLHG